MDKNAKYAVFALAVLALGVLGVAGAYLGLQIEASQVTPSQNASDPGATPIKFGANQLKNGPRSIYPDNEVILTDDGLISIAKALSEGKVIEVRTSDGKILGTDADRIAPNDQFTLNAGEVSGLFAFYPDQL
jgi:hypothetical protein